jgi:hypothetical protein
VGGTAAANAAADESKRSNETIVFEERDSFHISFSPSGQVYGERWQERERQCPESEKQRADGHERLQSSSNRVVNQGDSFKG